jgi:hypothetical protein
MRQQTVAHIHLLGANTRSVPLVYERMGKENKYVEEIIEHKKGLREFSPIKTVPPLMPTRLADGFGQRVALLMTNH